MAPYYHNANSPAMSVVFGVAWITAL